MDQAVRILERLIQFKTVDNLDQNSDFETGAVYLLKVAHQMGLESRLELPVPNKPALVAKVAGRSEESLLLLAHLDVAPVDHPSQWKYPPFGGQLAGQAIWGRGAIDCKGLIVVWLTILQLLQDLQVPLRRSVVMMATTDEESGDGLGIRWLLDSTPEAEKVSCALNEGGGYPTQFGQRSFITCQVGEKGLIWLRACNDGSISFQSKRAHLPATIPTATHRLLETLLPFPLSYVCHGSMLAKLSLSWLQRCSPQKLDLESLFHQQVEISVDQNTVDLKLRILPSDDSNSTNLRHQLLQALKLENRPWQQIDQIPATVSSLNHPLYHQIESTVNSALPGFGLIPHVTSGYSDSQYLRQNGIPVFGFFPLPMGSPITNTHRLNEHLKVIDLRYALEILLEIVIGYCT